VDAVRVQLAHGGRDLAGVEQGVVDAVLRQPGQGPRFVHVWTAPLAAIVGF
jgi:hypothetical protein